MLFSPNLFRPVMYGVVVGILLLMTGQLYRRVYYVVLDSAAAARISVLYFFVICFGLVGLLTTGNLSALTVFLILSVGWVVVSPIFFGDIAFCRGPCDFCLIIQAIGKIIGVIRGGCWQRHLFFNLQTKAIIGL